MEIADQAVLIVHLGALGAVVRSTSLLATLRREHPRAKIIWLTEKSALPLLQNHPEIDLALDTSADSIFTLMNFEFSAAYVIDKSLKAVGLARTLNCHSIKGFSAVNGAIVPATSAAKELWGLGLDNYEKFFINEKSETQLVCEALELKYHRDEYDLPLGPQEQKAAKQRAQLWSKGGKKIVVGLNTGCSPVIPYKKLSIAFQKQICQTLLNRGDIEVVLLGGSEDGSRNRQIADGLNITLSPTESGLRDGLISIAACDIVVTGDSLGMHMAISQKKWVVAWFGPTCAQEIDLYDRGQKVLTKAACSPCWKRSCQKAVMCYDQVELSEIISGVEKGIQFWQQMSLSKPPFSEIYF
jgi:heptosyltransferase-2